ncbi:GspH/FimT family pseudopilin [Sphingobium sufflavum]|uniref:GspH/FimT family pseudopilin n=1 Tax=Sphingobium sufflavum TaxID=1129547 RepID=UPI001F3F1212|nr:GspH/FimT family pseudopilin [Sphingobium sufflavum]MCE7797501.1 GspH/FimT family pseudopilin [Sphingobium sufflavum]
MRLEDMVLLARMGRGGCRALKARGGVVLAKEGRGCDRLGPNGGRVVRSRSAEHGFTPFRRSAEHGFTLVELMVVLVIIGLMSGAVLLTMRDPRGGLTEEVDRFAGRVRAARDRAVVLARPVALWVSPAGYGFEERRDGRWVPLDAKPLVNADWNGGARAEAGAASAGRARLWFDTIGRADQPMAFTLKRDGRSLPVSVGLDGRVVR